MTAPIWIASPPEVHSALLSSGPGGGPLLAAAAAWSGLSAQYVEIADELTTLLAVVQTGTWQGPTAAAYAAANAPYLTWLLRAGANSAAMATQQQTAATAYTVALAAMPTLAELAANHATHAVLVATNFFGINTIPIALNEADYSRMWVQAATVMSTYQSVATAAVASAPPSAPAPQIVKANAVAASDQSPPDKTDQVMQWLQQIGYTDFYNDVVQPLINALSANPYLQLLFSGFDPYLLLTGNPLSFFSPFNVGFALGYPMTISQFVAFLSQTFGFIGADLTAAFASGNPATIGFTLIFTAIEAIGTIITDVIALLKSLLEPTLALIPAIMPLLAMPPVVAAVTPSVLGGLAGLAGLHGVPVVVAPPAVPPVALALAPTPVAAPMPAPAPPAPAVASAPAAPVAPPPPPPPAPPLAPVDAFGYLVGGMGLDARRAASTSARRKKAPEPDSAAEAAPAAVAEEQARARRRRRVKTEMIGRGYEYMDLEPDDAPAASQVSQRGLGPLGFTGTVPAAEPARPTGLTTLAQDSVDGVAATPMVPGTWET